MYYKEMREENSTLNIIVSIFDYDLILIWVVLTFCDWNFRNRMVLRMSAINKQFKLFILNLLINELIKECWSGSESTDLK